MLHPQELRPMMLTENHPARGVTRAPAFAEVDELFILFSKWSGLDDHLDHAVDVYIGEVGASGQAQA